MSLQGIIARGCHMALAVPLVASSLWSAAPATAVAAATPACDLVNAAGTPVKHVIHIQFDNVHFRRDNPNVPSDLEQMPNLLNFIEQNGTLLANEHTPLIAHTADDLLTGLTGVYGDQHGITMNNSFEYYNNSSAGAYNTSAFTYWTDTIAPDPANSARTLPFEMIDSNGKNLQAPWVPFVNGGCNFGAVSTVNMVLENNGNDVNQVFGSNSAEAKESSSNKTNDFVGIAVHCADAHCSTVGSGALTNAKRHDSGISCGFSTPGNPLPDLKGGSECGAYAPGEQGYVNKLKSYDVAFGRFFSQLKAIGIDQTNTVFIIHSDENDHYVGTPPLNSGCDGPTTACEYNRNFKQGVGPGVGEVTTDLPLLLKQQGLYDFGMVGGTGSTQGTPRLGFTNVDQAYAIDFDTSPGFWVISDSTSTSTPNPDRRKLEHALANVTAPNPYLNNGQGGTEPLFRYLIDFPGMKALHMITADPGNW